MRVAHLREAVCRAQPGQQPRSQPQIPKQPVSQQTIDEILSWSTSRLAQIVAEASTPSSSPTIEIEPPAL